MGLDIMFYETDNQNYVKEYLDYLDYLDKDYNAEFAYGEEFCYFRKKNCLVSWAERTVGIDKDCVVSNAIDKSNIETLLKTIDDILALIPSEELKKIEAGCRTYEDYPYWDGLPEEVVKTAEKKLPTTSGFFFGDTCYDTSYIWQLKEIKKQFAEVVKEMKPTKYYHLVFSW